MSRFFMFLAIAVVVVGQCSSFGLAQSNTSDKQEVGKQDGDDADWQDLDDFEKEPSLGKPELKSSRMVDTDGAGGIRVNRTRGKEGEISVTDHGGKRTIKIKQDPRTGIVVEIVRTYGPDDADILVRKHPELADYIELFPTQVGEHQIEMNLSLKSVHRARTPELLKEKHPLAFNLYRRYYKPKRGKN